jgi:hypothetical protein
VISPLTTISLGNQEITLQLSHEHLGPSISKHDHSCGCDHALFLVLELSCGMVLTDWQAHPNCNLILNCVGSPRCFLRQKLQDEKRTSLSELAKGHCTSFVGTGGVLLKVCNREEECRTWSLVATTSQIQALRLSLPQTLMRVSLFLFISKPCLTFLSIVYISSTPNQVYSLVRIHHRVILHRFLCSPSLRKSWDEISLRGRAVTPHVMVFLITS